MTTSNIAEQYKTGYFDYERWDVYRAALEFIVVVKDIVTHFPRGNADKDV